MMAYNIRVEESGISPRKKESGRVKKVEDNWKIGSA
jgi:hypothetical protein